MSAHDLRDAAAKAFLAGRYAKAAELNAELGRLEPAEPRHQVRVGDCQRKARRPLEAIESYRDAAAKYAKAEHWLKAMSVCKLILEIEPHHPAALGMLVELNTKRLMAPARAPADAPGTFAPSAKGSAAKPAGAWDDAWHDPNTFSADDLDIETTPGTPGESHEFEFNALPPAEAAPANPPPPPPAQTPAAVAPISLTLDGLEAETGAERRLVAAMSEAAGRPESIVAGVLAKSIEEDALTPPGDDDAEVDLVEEDLISEIPAFAQDDIPLLSDLPQEAFLELLKRADLRQIGAEGVIIREGDQGSSLCILVGGRARVVTQSPAGQIELGTLSEGAFFGEMAMLTGERRAASVIATEDCDVLEIDQKVLQLLAQAFPAVGHSIARFYRDRLMNRVSYISPLFQSFPPNIRPRLAAQFALREVAADEVLIREGQPGEGLYVVVSGTALVSRVDPQGRARPVNLMVEGDVFGEISLLSGEPATATVTAKRRMIVLALPHRLFQHVVDAFPEVLDAALALWREREKHDRRLAGTHEHMSGLRRLALRV